MDLLGYYHIGKTRRAQSWGIIIAARLEGRKGGKTWDLIEPEGYGSIVDLSPHMKEHHFLDIKRFMPFLFADESKKEHDPWWQFGTAVENYNQNRQQTIKLSLLKVFNESMSAFVRERHVLVTSHIFPALMASWNL